MEHNGILEKDIDKAAELILSAKYVVALTGAGMSVESGIRPFRGPDGLWTERGEPPMDGFRRFMSDPKSGWEKLLTGELYPTELVEAFFNAKPNPGHHALAELESLGILKYLITQNVDNLHRDAGNKNVAEIHGNIRKLRCIDCNTRFPIEEISLAELPPRCPKCKGMVKTDGVMFGEPIPQDVLRICQQETDKCDCMLTAGTTALIYPAAGFPQEVSHKGGMLIEVDPYVTALTPMCTVSLRGKGGDVLPVLVEHIKVRMNK